MREPDKREERFLNGERWASSVGLFIEIVQCAMFGNLNYLHLANAYFFLVYEKGVG